jgi:hypothetical protein
MQQEKDSKPVLTYEEFKNVKKILYSKNVMDYSMALQILEMSDPKKVLPYLFFIIMELSWIRRKRGAVKPKKEDPELHVLFDVWGKITVCKGIKSIVDKDVWFGSNPFSYKSYIDLHKILNNYSTRKSAPSSIIDSISRYVGIKQIVDSIAIQSNPEDYYELEKDINEYIKNDFLEHDGQNCAPIVNLYGFTMHYDLKKAVEKTIQDYDKTRKPVESM